MSRTVVVDASVWVARLIAGDIFHDVCRKWLQEQRNLRNALLSPAFLLAEVGGAIARRTNEPKLAHEAIHSLEKLPALRLIKIEAALLREAADLAAQLGLRGADAIYVATAVKLGASLATLDEDQRQRAHKVVAIEEII